MNTLNIAFRKVAYDNTTGIGDHEPLAIKENQGVPTIQCASWNGHEVRLLSSQEASANHETTVNAFTTALGKSASYFSEEMKQNAKANGLTREIIKQVFNSIDNSAKKTWSVMLNHCFSNSMRDARSQLDQLSPDQLLQSQDLPEEFKTEVLRHHLEIAVRPANEFVNYLTTEVLFDSKIGDCAFRCPASFEEIEQSLQSVAHKTELALHLLIDAVEQKALEDSIAEIDIDEDNVSEDCSVTHSVLEDEGIIDEASELANESDIDDRANVEDEIEEYGINPPAHNTASEYFYASSHAMLNAVQSTARGCKAKINGRDVLAQRFNELAQSYEKKSAYCEKVALEIHHRENSLIMDNLFLAADYFTHSIEARKEAVFMTNAGDEANAELWADIANSYEETMDYTDRGVEALKGHHDWLARHWINAAGAARLAISAISHEEQQAVVPYLKKAADVALITAKSVDQAAIAWQNNNHELSNFWTDAAQISNRHFQYREELVSAVRDRDITLILSAKEKAEHAEAYTNLLIAAANLAKDGEIGQAYELKATAVETYPDIEPVA